MREASEQLLERDNRSSRSPGADVPVYLREPTYAGLPRRVGPNNEIVYAADRGLSLTVRDERSIVNRSPGMTRIPLVTPFETNNLVLPLERFAIGARRTDPVIVEAASGPYETCLMFSATVDDKFKPDAFVVNGMNAGGRALAIGPGRCRYNIAIKETWTEFYVLHSEPLSERGWPVSRSEVSVVELGRSCWSRLAGLFDTAFRIAAEDPFYFAKPNAAKGLEESIELLLDEAIQNAEGVLSPGRGTQSSHQIATRADAFLQKNIGRPVYNSEVCRELGVSPRALHDAVQAVMKMPLQRYLKLQRLWAVRRALIAAPSNALVKTVALDYGFWHLARFSAEYARFFGETPSMTLRRSRALGDDRSP